MTQNVSLAVGQSAVLNYNLSSVEEVVVTGTQVVLAETAIGPNAIFDVAAVTGFANRLTEILTTLSSRTPDCMLISRAATWTRFNVMVLTRVTTA
jgi:hypothetical protein